MDQEASENIENLLAQEGSEAQQKAALQRLGEMLEESYILNLPPSKNILQALLSYSKKRQAPAALSKRAAKLYKQYKI